jgi:hypothetical protein
MADFSEMFRTLWPAGAAIMAHIWRTESSRQKHELQIIDLKDRAEEDRRSTTKYREEIKRDVDEIKNDIKTLLQRGLK